MTRSLIQAEIATNDVLASLLDTFSDINTDSAFVSKEEVNALFDYIELMHKEIGGVVYSAGQFRMKSIMKSIDVLYEDNFSLSREVFEDILAHITLLSSEKLHKEKTMVSHA